MAPLTPGMAKTKDKEKPVCRDHGGAKEGVDLRLQRLFEAMADQFYGKVSLLKESHGVVVLELSPESGDQVVQARVESRPNSAGYSLVSVDNGSGPVLVEDLPSAVLAVALR